MEQTTNKKRKHEEVTPHTVPIAVIKTQDTSVKMTIIPNK